LNILVYSHSFAPNIGGVEEYVMLLAQGLAHQAGENELQVTLVTLAPAGKWDDATLPFRVVRRPGLAVLLMLFWRADVIHLAGPSFLPMLFGLLLRKPVVVEHSGYQAVCPNGLLLDERTKTVCPGHFMAGRYLECVRCNAAIVSLRKSLTMLVLTHPRRWLCGRVARNVGPSDHIIRRVALPNSATIRHGVLSLPADRRPGSDHLVRPVCFAYMGRLVREKGVHVLLASARELAALGYDFRLKIIGDGPDRSRLEEMTDRYGLRGHTLFTGYLQGDARWQALQGVSATVMPSTCEDVAPVAAIEHMMQGRLLIASDIGGLGELVEGVGLRFAPGDIEGLASCLRRVLDQPDLAYMLGEKARQRALRLFLRERMVAEHLALYRDLAAPRVRSDVPARAER
jgi:glycosyltransferase involved in cell wall biosynthesis